MKAKICVNRNDYKHNINGELHIMMQFWCYYYTEYFFNYLAEILQKILKFS